MLEIYSAHQLVKGYAGFKILKLFVTNFDNCSKYYIASFIASYVFPTILQKDVRSKDKTLSSST